MDTSTILLGLAGLVVLTAGAEALVRGASRLAASFGVSPLVVGLTVVAMGTSAPEMTVSIVSALKGESEVALGNVVGSNTFNVLFILGLSALVAPLVVAQKLVRVDVPVMIAACVTLVLMALDGVVSRLDGLLLVAGLVAYIVFTIRSSKRETPEVQAEYAKGFTPPAHGGSRWVAALLVLAGLVALILGSKWFVEAAVSTARSLGVSELVIGLTIVAAGTSLPEVATSVLATFRGERDIAVGNVVGSNIFNVLCVMGVSATVAPSGVPVGATAISFDMPIMLGAALACLPIFFTGWTIARWEGFVFLGYYAAYLTFLILDATRSEGVDTFGAAMAWFVIPLTVLTLGVVTFRELRRRRRAAGTPQA